MRKKVCLSIAFLMCIVLLFGTMAGCKKAEDGSGQTAATRETEKATTKDGATEKAAEEPTTIVDNTKLKEITIFTEMDPATAQSCRDLNDHEVFKELERRTGVRVNWIHPTSPEQFDLMIASGVSNLPDLIRHNWPGIAGGPAKYCNDGIIIKLNDLIPEYAPNFAKLMEEYPAVKMASVDAYGDFYFMPMVKIDAEVNVYKGLLVRQDWMEKLNIETPTDIDSFYEALVRMRDGDPNGNGEKDEWAFSGAGSVTSTSAHSIGRLLWSWNTTTGFHLEDGKVVFGPITPQFKEGLMFLNKLYEEGLLDPDYLLLDRSKLDAKVMDDKVAFFYHYQPTNFMTLMADKDPEFEVLGIPYLKAPDGTYGNYDSSLVETVVGAGCVAITAACKYPEEALKWLDYGYSYEGNILLNFGIEGKSYVMEDGIPKYTDLILNNPEGLTKSVAHGKWSLSVNKWAMIQDVEYYRQYVVTDYSRKSIANWAASIDFDPYQRMLPAIPRTPEESEQIAAIMTEVNTYKDEMCDKFVLGKEDFSNYDNFVETIKKLNIDEAIRLTQVAYDRYIGN
jgi:putative aldouronate transport system substrate-binding protein